jgi:DNA-directed RNA polymerase beta' subunit
MVDNRADIESVYLEVWSDDDLRHAGHQIRPGTDDVRTSLVKDDELNPYLGATTSQMCLTCENHHPLCPGHFGYAELNTILLRSFYVYKKYVPMLLNCTCIYCWGPIMDFSTVPTVPGESRLKTCSEKAQTMGVCHNVLPGNVMCGHLTYHVSDSDDSRNPSMNTYSEVEIKLKDKKNASDISHKVPLKIVREMFRNLLSDEKTRIDLGMETVDVDDFFFSVLPIMPNNVRPDMNFDGRVDRHNFTHLYSKILENVANMTKKMESEVVASILKSEEKKFLNIHETPTPPWSALTTVGRSMRITVTSEGS